VVGAERGRSGTWQKAVTVVGEHFLADLLHPETAAKGDRTGVLRD